MYMILFVLNDSLKSQDIMQVWEEAGVGGITILASTGLRRLKDYAALREDFPLIPSLDDLLANDEVTNRTIFTIVKDEAMVDQVIEATQKVIGDLNKPHTGILVVLPVVRAYGLNRED